jgi:hypothetical protein
MPRAPGRIFADGEPALADALAFALRAPGQDSETAESLTHPFHSYPARLHPATARVLVDVVSQGAPADAPIVDPFCGSGTTLVEARVVGLRAIGIDLNPLAVLVAHAKTWTAAPRRRQQLKTIGTAIARDVHTAGKLARRAGAEAAPLRAPQGFDPNARNRRLASWFAPHVRRELEMLAGHLDALRLEDAELADVLTAVLSAILYKVSSRTSDTDGTWVDRNIARGAAARLFGQRVELLCAGLDDMARAAGPTPSIYERDARMLGTLVEGGTAAGIVTSPPYAGTYDYAEHQRLRFDFLALRHRELDDGEIGARRHWQSGTSDPTAADRAWTTALADTVAAIAAALHTGRMAALVIGDSVARRRAVYALDDVRAAVTDDLEVAAWASQHRPMLGGIERQAFGDRPKSEHIILLRRR